MSNHHIIIIFIITQLNNAQLSDDKDDNISLLYIDYYILYYSIYLNVSAATMLLMLAVATGRSKADVS